MKYDKLVRDNIPSIIEKSGKKCRYKQVKGKELGKYLYAKLDEEVAELHNAKTPEEKLEEIIDIEEVLMTIFKHEELDDYKYFLKLTSKNREKGRFKQGYILKEVYEDTNK